MTGRTFGAAGRENAGVSSGRLVRIQRTENPRIPEEGSSALGKSGPKARPKGVVDGQQVEIPVLYVIRTAGTHVGCCEPGGRSPAQAEERRARKNRRATQKP